MDVNLIFKIAAVGILVTIIQQVLKQSGRDEQAFFGILVWFDSCTVLADSLYQ